MRKIVRLTENDLVRLVKRVLSEQSNNEGGSGKKLKLLNDVTGALFSNITVYSTEPKGIDIYFKASGGEEVHEFWYSCPGHKVKDDFRDFYRYKFTPEGDKYFQSFCEEFTQNKSKSNDSSYV
jgi:hypothetical protein